MRPICKNCNISLCAVNYSRNNITHYRTVCETCRRKQKKLPPTKPRWMSKGYKKKNVCDYCGFQAVYQTQMLVYHINGNLEDNIPSNLRTICLNCVEIVKRREVNWKRGDLQIDSLKNKRL